MILNSIFNEDKQMIRNNIEIKPDELPKYEVQI